MTINRQEQKLATRKKIRTIAKSLFEKQGFEATTSRQIAQASGVAAGTVFVHFPNKRAILMDILYEDIEAVVVQAFASVPQDEETAVQLTHIAAVLYRYYSQHIELSRVLLQHNLLQPDDTAGFAQQIGSFVQAITACLQRGQARGDVTAVKEAETLAYLFVSTYFFLLVSLVREELPDVETALVRLDVQVRAIIS